MSLESFANTLARVLPALKTRVQLAGLGIGLCFGLAAHFAEPGNNVALLTAGGVGISIMVFGQLFEALAKFPARERSIVFLASLTLFFAFTVTLVVLTARSLLVPQMMISPMPATETFPQDTDQNGKAERGKKRDGPASATHSSFSNRGFAAVSSRDDHQIRQASFDYATERDGYARISSAPNSIKHSEINYTIKYNFSDDRDSYKLHAYLRSAEDSRAGLFPPLEAINWPVPSVVVTVNNPSDTNLVLTSMQIEASSIEEINEVILVGLEVLMDSTDAKPGVLGLVNLGWGNAHSPKLEVAFSSDGKNISDWKTMSLPDLSDRLEIDLNPILPPRSDWHQLNDCRTLRIFARMHYKDDKGKQALESFNTIASTNGCAGGEIYSELANSILSFRRPFRHTQSREMFQTVSQRNRQGTFC